jgi:hypothetical protein
MCDNYTNQTKVDNCMINSPTNFTRMNPDNDNTLRTALWTILTMKIITCQQYKQEKKITTLLTGGQ